MKRRVYWKWFLVFGIVLGFVFSCFFGCLAYNSSTESLEFELKDVSFEKSRMVESFVGKQEVEFWRAYDRDLFVKFLKSKVGSAEYNETFDLIREGFMDFDSDSIGVSNASGVILVDKDERLIGYDTSLEYPESVAYLQDDFIEASNTYMVLPHPDSGSFYVLIMKKIFDYDGEFLGFFAYRILNEDVVKLLKEVREEVGVVDIYLVDENYYLLTPSVLLDKNGDGILNQVVNTSAVAQCVDTEIERLKSGEDYEMDSNMVEYVSYSGEEVYGIFAVIEEPRWCLLVEMKKVDGQAFIIKKAVFESLAVLFGIIFVFFLVGRTIDWFNR